jgi:hypothetical protein
MDKIKKFKRQRFWLRMLFVAIAYVLPFTILAIRFDFFQFKEAEVKVSGVVLLIGVLLLFQFRKELHTWIEGWEFSLLKIVLLGFAKVWAFLLAIGIITLAKYGLENIEYIVGWLSIPQIVAYLAVKPFSEQANYNVQREIRKLEIKEALQEGANVLPSKKRKV